MSNHYKKLLLTSTLILTGLNVDAFANRDSYIADETSKTSLTTPSPKNSGTRKNSFYKEEYLKESDSVPIATQATSQSLNEEDSILEDKNISFFSNLGTAESSLDNFIIPQENLFVPARLGKIKVVYNDKEFFITKGEEKYQVQRWNLSQELRGIKEDQFKNFLKAGYLSVNKIEDDYVLKANLRLRGGGPILGAIGYWGVKGLGYAVAAAMAIGAPGCGTAAVMAGTPSIIAITESAAVAAGVALGMAPTP